MNTLKKKIKALAKELSPKVVSHRRYIHKNPELSFEEFNTIKYIRKEVKNIGITDVTEICKTGAIILIKGDKKGPCIALRADIDALPIHEKNKVSYRSKNKNIMHACGHDAHTACMLGALEILHTLKSELKGTIKVIFQPGEEKLPGGASMVIKEKGLENPSPECIIGQHVFPNLEAGKVGFKSGKYMASADEIYITVKGIGGHAALPQDLIDPVLISSHIIIALQQIVSRKTPQDIPTVLSFGKVEALGATNVIPDKVLIQGTLRTMNEEHRFFIHKELKKITTNLAKSFGGSAKVDIKIGYPVLDNDPFTTKTAKDLAINYLGKENVVNLPIRMTAEDFAYYSQKIKGCFYRLGTKKKEGAIMNLHSPNFDIDESSLEIGTGLMAYLAIETLNKKTN